MVVLAFATVHELTKFRPEIELRRAFVALAQADTIRQVSGFGWTEGTGDNRVVSTVYTSGQVRASDAAYGARFRLIRLGKERYSDISGELRSLEGAHFLTYTAPGPDLLSNPFVQPDSWLRFGSDEFSLWGPLFPGVTFPLSSLFDPRATPWTTESLQRARRLLTQADFSSVGFDGTTEEVNGVRARVMDVRPDREVFESFLLGLIRAREGREPGEAERVRAAQFSAGLSRFTFRVWVGEQNHVPLRIQTAGLWRSEDGQEVPVDFLVEFSGVNDPFEVVAPPSPASFRTTLGSSFGLLPSAGVRTGGRPLASLTPMSSLPTVVFTQTDDLDTDGLDAVLETFYGTNQRVADTDGDGMSDGEEVRTGRNPRGTGTLFGFGLGR